MRETSMLAISRICVSGPETRSEVDTEVALKAKKTIETFGFLTADCKDGVNTC